MRKIDSILWIAISLAMIGGALGFTGWLINNSVREAGAVVLIIFVPVAILGVATALIGFAMGRRFRQSNQSGTLSRSKYLSRPKGAGNSINNDSRRRGIFLVFLAGAICTGAGGSAGMYLSDAPPIMFVVPAVTSLAMIRAGMLMARRVP